MLVITTETLIRRLQFLITLVTWLEHYNELTGKLLIEVIIAGYVTLNEMSNSIYLLQQDLDMLQVLSFAFFYDLYN